LNRAASDVLVGVGSTSQQQSKPSSTKKTRSKSKKMKTRHLSDVKLSLDCY